MAKVEAHFPIELGHMAHVQGSIGFTHWYHGAVARVVEHVLRQTEQGPTRYYVLEGSREEVPVLRCHSTNQNMGASL